MPKALLPDGLETHHLFHVCTGFWVVFFCTFHLLAHNGFHHYSVDNVEQQADGNTEKHRLIAFHGQRFFLKSRQHYDGQCYQYACNGVLRAFRSLAVECGLVVEKIVAQFLFVQLSVHLWETRVVLMISYLVFNLMLKIV